MIINNKEVYEKGFKVIGYWGYKSLNYEEIITYFLVGFKRKRSVTLSVGEERLEFVFAGSGA